MRKAIAMWFRGRGYKNLYRVTMRAAQRWQAKAERAEAVLKNTDKALQHAEAQCKELQRDWLDARRERNEAISQLNAERRKVATVKAQLHDSNAGALEVA